MSMTKVAVSRPVTVLMFTLAALVFGFILLGRLGVTLLPDLSYPTLTVRTEYTGAAPTEVENLVTKPIEEALGVVKNMRQIRSISRSGQSDVILEFDWGADMGLAGLEVREKLDILQLPLDVQRPTLLRFNPSLDPIVRLSLSQAESTAGDSTAQLIELRRFAEEEIKKRLESVIGVASVKISGGLEDEIQVQVNQDRLAQLNLSIEQIAARLKAENVNMSGGRLEQGTQQYLIRTVNQFQTIDEIENSIIANVGNKPVYLHELAKVNSLYKEREAITRVDGAEAVEIAIYKEGDANTVAVAKSIMARVGGFDSLVGDELKVTTLYNQSTFIENAIDEVLFNAFIGGILAMLVLYFFLRNFVATFIISLSIPLSVIVAFNMMFSFDITMNIMSLGGLALAVGLLVDNGIVVLENIQRHREAGDDIRTAAVKGTEEVAMAIGAATLTTVAVFVPLIFVEGIAGQLFSDQALTVSFSLIISLLVAITVIPTAYNVFNRSKEPLPPSRHRKTVGFGSWILFPFVFVAGLVSKLFKLIFKYPVAAFNGFYGWLAKGYHRLIRVALKQRAVVVLVALLSLAGAAMLVPQLGLNLIPQLSQGEFNIDIKAPSGTAIDQTDEIIRTAQARVSQLAQVERVFSVAGSGNRLDASPDQGGDNWGQLSVVMKPPVNQQTEEAVIAQMREVMGQFAGVEYDIARPTLFSFKTPLEIEIRGYNLEQAKALSERITAQMEANDRFSDIKSTVKQGYPEVQIRFDHERASTLGLSVPDIANKMVTTLKGDVATKYSFRDRKIDVLVRADERDRASVEDIRKIIVNPLQARPVTLDAVADVSLGIGPSEIHRIEQERAAIIEANLAYGDLGDAAAEAQNIVDSLPSLSGMEVVIGGQNEEMQSSFQSLQFALLLAVFLVYLVMASQFESLLHPLVILFSIPLALVGAVLALYVTGSDVSVVVFIGLILLAGIVVNNAIVLIDLINQLRRAGTEYYEAIQQACESRLRPIVMTTMTTTLGMLPLALGLGEGAEIRAPMAITVIGGLLFSTLLTLVVIPVAYTFTGKRL